MGNFLGDFSLSLGDFFTKTSGHPGGRKVASFNKSSRFSATTLGIKTFSITTLSIMVFSIMTLSIMESSVMLSGKLCFVSFTLSVTSPLC